MSAKRPAGVAMSVLDRHFETKADPFAESVLVPFAELLERTTKDWLRQRDAFDDLFRQLRLMAELEAERRQRFSAAGLDLTLRVLMAMVLGTTAYDGIILPHNDPAQSKSSKRCPSSCYGDLERQPTHSANQAVVFVHRTHIDGPSG